MVVSYGALRMPKAKICQTTFEKIFLEIRELKHQKTRKSNSRANPKQEPGGSGKKLEKKEKIAICIP